MQFRHWQQRGRYRGAGYDQRGEKLVDAFRVAHGEFRVAQIEFRVACRECRLA
ncbi:MAG TPA: hypothetical protein VF940_11005 [Streptosporangiaceae bacterium]